MGEPFPDVLIDHTIAISDDAQVLLKRRTVPLSRVGGKPTKQVQCSRRELVGRVELDAAEMLTAITASEPIWTERGET